MSDEWPKPWGAITPDLANEPFQAFSTQYINAGPLRIYEGTIYVNVDAVWETDENRDLWMPLGNYIAGEEVDNK